MEDDLKGERGWNIFARELALILNGRGYRLGQLNDRAGLHPMKGNRLQHALRQPKFNLLSPDDLEQVALAFGLTGEDLLRLRAAVLATAIEDTLMDRINAEDALTAAEQIFPILLRALHEPPPSASGLGAIKSRAESQSAVIDTQAGVHADTQLETAIQLYDSALLYLHYAQKVEPARAVHYGAIAQALLRSAQERLGADDPNAPRDEIKQAWRKEFQLSEAAAQRLISQPPAEARE